MSTENLKYIDSYGYQNMQDTASDSWRNSVALRHLKSEGTVVTKVRHTALQTSINCSI